MKTQTPPELRDGCQEILGFSVVLKPDWWLTQDGRQTIIWDQRGIWKTEQEAQEARDTF